MAMFDKSPEWGSRFQVPENQEIDLTGMQLNVTDRIVVQMVDNYENAVAAEIAAGARECGASDVTVLNKAAIIDALMKRTPKKFERRSYTANIDMPVCPTCGSDSIYHRRSRFCSDCGQAIDWTEVVK